MKCLVATLIFAALFAAMVCVLMIAMDLHEELGMSLWMLAPLCAAFSLAALAANLMLEEIDDLA